MTPARNPRRAYDREGREIPPMTLGNMRKSVRSRCVWAECLACRREVELAVDQLSDWVPVPDVALRLRCSSGGSKEIKTIPRWV